MRLPPLFATCLWMAATAGSTAMVWTATSIVAADVTDRAPQVVASEDVVSQLESAPVATTAPTSPTTRPSGPASTVPSGRSPVPAPPSAPLPTAPSSRGPQTGATVAPSSPSTTTRAPAAAAPTTRPPAPTTTQAPRPSATYSTSGGVVRVACSGFFIELISAIPNNGYSVRVLAAGPGNVDVRFSRSGREESVKAVCYGRPIRYYESSPSPAPGSP